MAIRLGIIGYGGMAGWHATNVCRVPDVSVRAVYDIDPVRLDLGKKDGYIAYDTLETFLADTEINLVLIATPNDVHPDLAIAAMDAGKHVICEKPVAMSLKEFDRMTAAAQRNQVVFTAHHNRRWDKDYQTAKAVLESGELGQVFTIQSRLHGTGGTIFGWRAELEHGGGMMFDWGVHFLDQLFDMCGYDTFTEVYCQFTQVMSAEVEDYFTLVMNSNKGYRAQIEIGTYMLHDMPRWLIGGDEGTCFIQDFQAKEGNIIKAGTKMEDQPVVLMTDSGPTRTFAPRPKNVKQYLPLPAVTREWTELYHNVDLAMQGKAELIVQPWQVRKVIAAMEACFESARTGKVVSLL